MRKAQILLIAAAAVLVSCSRPIPRGNWSEAPYKALCSLMKECKAEADAAGKNVNYAIFDFDNTTIMNDVELAAMQWQLENLKFKFTPDQVEALFAPNVPDLDSTLTGIGAEGVSGRMLIDDIESSYRALVEAAGVECGMDIAPEKLAELRKMPEYEDFRVKVWALYEGDYLTFDYREGFFIIAALFEGMNYAEVDSLVKVAVDEQVAKGCIKEVEWTSPDMGKAGKVSMMVPDGLALSQEMRNLYTALPKYGIDVYVFSASLEAVVEAMACDPKFLGLDTAQVFALRLKRDSTDNIIQEYRKDYVRPYRTGKTEAIKAYIQPRYDGRGPVLVGGDSMGDYSMLTSFDDMKLGIIVDKNQSGPGIGELRDQALEAERGGAASRYVLQRRDNPNACFAIE